MPLPNTSIQTKKIEIDGILLSFMEKNETSANTIFFIHGNSGSSNTWINQLEDERLNIYRLIAIDLPAHGESSADEALRYGVTDLAAIMVKTINSLIGNNAYVLVGFSLGSNIVSEMLTHSIKPAGLVFIGSTIIGDDWNLSNIWMPDLDTSVLFAEAADDDVLKNFYSQIFNHNNLLAVNSQVADYQKVNPRFRTTLLQKAMDGNISNEFALLRQYKMPALFIFGMDDKIVKSFFLDEADIPKWKNTIYKLKEAGHFLHIDQPFEVNKLIVEYSNEVFKDAHA
ncbi:MAG: alpha/beta hydrolase [Chitinophagaceae bacterium]|jgi:pimeloyl-ACP methyl ester carboxylesterase|nr:alpha/beta hydrolase [Chitinophagaceae bacterium]